MLQIISKLNLQKLSGLRQFCAIGNVEKFSAKELQNNWYLQQYYIESGRHIMFDKDAKLLFQFDEETRNLMPWLDPRLPKNVEWNVPLIAYSNDELIQAFECLLNYSVKNNIDLTDRQFDQFIDNFCKRMEQFTLNEVVRAMQIFAKHPLNLIQMKKRNYIELFYAFDQSSTIHCTDVRANQLLFVSSIWMGIPGFRDTYFSLLVSRMFNRFVRIISGPQLAQLLFYINSSNKRIEDIRAFENIFEQVLDDLTLEEVATLLWTFIRLETKIQKAELRDKFFNYLERHDLSQLNDVQLSKILFIASKIITPNMVETNQLSNILNPLKSVLHEKDLKICILLANVGVGIRYFDNDINKHIFKRCIKNSNELNNLALNDLEYLSRILSMKNDENNIELKKVGSIVLDETKKRLDIVAQKGSYRKLVNIIRNLTMIDIYDLELLDNFLSPEYVECIHKSSKLLDICIYEIDGYCRINLKGIYKGNLLPYSKVERLRYLSCWVPDRINRYTKIDEYSYYIEDAVNELFTFSQYAHAIPHRKYADLFVCLDKTTLKPVDISANFPPLYTCKIIEASSLTKNDPNLIVFAFIAGNTKEYKLDHNNKYEKIPIGYLPQKIVQLKMLGFHPIAVPATLIKIKNLQQMRIEQFIIEEVNRILQEIGVTERIKPKVILTENTEN